MDFLIIMLSPMQGTFIFGSSYLSITFGLFICLIYLLHIYGKFACVNISHLCHKYYSKNNLDGAYSKTIILVLDKSAQKEGTDIKNRVILPIIQVTQFGRPQEKRTPFASEFHKQKSVVNVGSQDIHKLYVEILH